jgi:hypothetical protein
MYNWIGTAVISRYWWVTWQWCKFPLPVMHWGFVMCHVTCDMCHTFLSNQVWPTQSRQLSVINSHRITNYVRTLMEIISQKPSTYLFLYLMADDKIWWYYSVDNSASAFSEHAYHGGQWTWLLVIYILTACKLRTNNRMHRDTLIHPYNNDWSSMCRHNSIDILTACLYLAMDVCESQSCGTKGWCIFDPCLPECIHDPDIRSIIAHNRVFLLTNYTGKAGSLRRSGHAWEEYTS